MALAPARQDALFAYMALHLAENGADGTALFQPLDRAASGVPAATRDSFARGLATPFGAAGWRRAWIAEDASGAIVGHIDLRARLRIILRRIKLLRSARQFSRAIYTSLTSIK